MDSDGLDILITTTEKLGDKVYELAVKVAIVQTQLKVLLGIVLLGVGGLMSSWFFLLRP